MTADELDELSRNQSALIHKLYVEYLQLLGAVEEMSDSVWKYTLNSGESEDAWNDVECVLRKIK